jgi:hypothetical protein
MTLLDYEELCRYWAKSPPTHLMVAAYLGVGKPAEGAAQSPQQSAQAQREAIAEILQGGGAAVVSRTIFEKNMRFTPTFDAAELFARKPVPHARHPEARRI